MFTAVSRNGALMPYTEMYNKMKKSSYTMRDAIDQVMEIYECIDDDRIANAINYMQLAVLCIDSLENTIITNVTENKLNVVTEIRVPQEESSNVDNAQ